ncbi:MAG: antiviral reverse transcriptase Drt3b [Methylotenera sp.]
MAKKIKIRTKSERVLLSDVLPYETPATFSNRHFYDFLVSNKINSETLGAIKKNFPKPFMQELIKSFFVNDHKNSPLPFNFKISHKENEFRELSICHPANQIKIVTFYEKYKNLILYYCNLSPFSIRKPVRVAKYTYYSDKKHIRKQSNESSLLEEFDKEYKNQKTFFVYKDFSNVHKFYEDTKFHRCEKKYSHLLKLDITKCFDSIYTHSVTWALISKDAVKQNKDTIEISAKTFGGEFDRLMQEVNHNETNGIIIGPELSRIFAELILQAIDVAVEKKLQSEKLTHKVNYEIFRYVDDYFVFYNEEQHKKLIVETLQHELKVYKLSLNSSKEENYKKPIITGITIAKEAINKLLREKLQYVVEIKAPEIDYVCPHSKGCTTNPSVCRTKSENCTGEPKSKIYIQSKNLITEFKTIIKQCDIEYKDIINYTLMLIETYSNEILEEHKNYLSRYDGFVDCERHHSDPSKLNLDELQKKHKFNKELQLIRAMIEIVEFTFFIASVSPRVATTIRLSRISSLFIQYLNNNKEKINDLKHQLFKVISDNLTLILKKNKLNKHTQVETLYLLLTINELGKNYRLHPSALMSFLNIEQDKKGKLKSEVDFNYFSITVALMCTKDLTLYEKIRKHIEQEIIRKFETQKSMIHKSTELILLMLDILSCPYIETSTKTMLLSIYGIDASLHNKIISFRKTWFIDWKGFNLHKELDAKRSREVY